MAFHRGPRDRDFTVMNNYHFRSVEMTLKAKGMISQILHYPDDWNFSVRGLASCCRESEAGVRSVLEELEYFGYLRRSQPRTGSGTFGKIIYDIYEVPLTMQPLSEAPQAGSPLAAPIAQLNTYKPNTYQPNIYQPTTKKESTGSLACGVHGNVLLTEGELENLREEYPDSCDDLIQELSVYIKRTGKTYKSHFLTLRSWAKREKEEAAKRTAEPDYSCEPWESL